MVRNNISLDNLIGTNLQGMVISPGPEKPATAGNLIQILSHYSGVIPILGICLGHQAIGLQFGADLVRADRPMHGKTSCINCVDSPLFKDLPRRLTVVRYHSLVLENLPDCLQIIAKTDSNEIMAIKHRTLEIYGLQFHPEAYLTEGGFKMMQNWAVFYDIAD